MQKKLAQLLTLFILVSSMAWPVQAYMHGEKDHKHNSQKLQEHNIDHGVSDLVSQVSYPEHSENEESVSCDHCCHFASHSTGVLEERCFSSFRHDPALFTILTTRFSSFILAPPFHPPIA